MPEATQSRLVGRETELRRLLALLDDAAAGRPVVALVSGDAGVGAGSRLCRADRPLRRAR
jgi:predicted ATPase